MLPDRTLFICDTYVNHDPTAEQIAEMTLLAAEEVRRFGLTPQGGAAVALAASAATRRPVGARRCATRSRILQRARPDLEVEGEMHGDAALVAGDPRPGASRARG